MRKRFEILGKKLELIRNNKINVRGEKILFMKGEKAKEKITSTNNKPKLKTASKGKKEK